MHAPICRKQKLYESLRETKINIHHYCVILLESFKIAGISLPIISKKSPWYSITTMTKNYSLFQWHLNTFLWWRFSKNFHVSVSDWCLVLIFVVLFQHHAGSMWYCFQVCTRKRDIREENRTLSGGWKRSIWLLLKGSLLFWFCCNATGCFFFK